MNDRQIGTVLAALRYWQREGLMSSGGEHDIATCGDTLEALDADEIDELCEQLNCASQIVSEEVGSTREIQREQQAVNYEEHLSIGGRSCRIRIKSDAYRFQCYAVGEVFNRREVKWNIIADVHHAKMKTRGQLAYGRDAVTEADFKDDRDRLLARMRELLSAKEVT